ncbi:MAG: cation-translocating P-type ATPase [Desulfobacteraceae bacterium]|nr:MAG: cation-translocating P-type ATPase [Desulfobacteraceae bacterium]
MKEAGSQNRWHTLSAVEALNRLGTDPDRGLESSEASGRLDRYGPNELEERGAKSAWRILGEQFTASMIIILIVAAVISALLGDSKDATAILAIVIINGLFGFRQEYKAEKAMAALKKLSVPNVGVLRDGSVQEVSARDLVPGDIVLFEEGTLIPADCRLLEHVRLQIQEAALTGESAPVEKDPDTALSSETPLAERSNMVYMGTAVTSGRGRGVVVHTGMETELGRIASMIQTVEDKSTPLQNRLKRLGRTLAAAALLLIGIVIVLGAVRGEDFKLLFLTAISLAVAAIPEGLPAVVTISLALGSQRLLKRHALIRKLPAVETLGSVTVICTDKTGTLTENRMAVTVLETLDRRIKLEDYRKETGGFPESFEKEEQRANGSSAIRLLLAGGALCNNAAIERNEEDGFRTFGDPTEAALLSASAETGLLKPDLEKNFPRIAEIPFDSERKRMTTIHRFESAGIRLPPSIESVRNDGRNSPFVAFTKGAVDALLSISNKAIIDGKVEPLTDEWRNRITEADNRLARQGMRVLGVSYKSLSSAPEDRSLDSVEQDLVFTGMMGIIDPPRPEAKDAVAKCRSAGILPVMITGDHPFTAMHIAEELGIARNGDVLTGQDLARKSVQELRESVEKISVYARVAPEHKLNIVQAFQEGGHIVSMTGDGVNDAPALKKADIGVAMGITGTDVSKEVADMVLLDDNFSTIVAAVEEGRIIYDNIRKFIKYLLTTNSGEILVMLVAPFLGMPLPLLPLQILWINLVTDGLPALALSLEPGERNVMNRPPRHPNETVFSRGVGRHILWVGLVMGLVPLGAGFFFWTNGRSEWQTIVFVTLTFSQLAHVLAIRSERDSLFTIGILSNRPLFGAVVLTALLQLAVIYFPPVSGLFHTVSLTFPHLMLCIGLSSLIFWVVEFEKLLTRRSRKRENPD